jgi:hypothetical protein
MHAYRPAVHGRLLDEKQLKDRSPRDAKQGRMPERGAATKVIQLFIFQDHVAAQHPLR